MDMVVISSAKFILKKNQRSIYLAPLFKSCSQKVRSVLSMAAVVTYKDACKMVQADEKKKRNVGLVCTSALKQDIIQILCVCVYD